MDQPVASMAGVRAQEDSTSSSLMDDPRALEIEAAGGTWLWRRRTALGETKQTDRQTNQQWRRRAERSGREEALPGGVGHGPPAGGGEGSGARGAGVPAGTGARRVGVPTERGAAGGTWGAERLVDGSTRRCLERKEPSRCGKASKPAIGAAEQLPSDGLEGHVASIRQGAHQRCDGPVAHSIFFRPQLVFSATLKKELFHR